MAENTLPHAVTPDPADLSAVAAEASAESTIDSPVVGADSTLASADGTPFAPPFVDAVGTPGSTDAADEVAGTVLAGRYRLVRQIGEGGMGSVWLAEQQEPVTRTVAVKLVRGDLGGRRVVARFEAERQAIARMEHPHIAKLLDAGTTETGNPFFVMELVNGVPLTRYADEAGLAVPDRLRLFQQVCAAVQHAHQKGIIHRDLKPGNILVESHDGKPVPKVIDFGLAKALTGPALTDGGLHTGFGAVLGTPLYMAPEQAAFDAVDVDTRADVYALGVILYELLTGTTPLSRDSVKKAALDEMLRLVREQDPPPPSSRLAERRKSSVGTGSASLPATSALRVPRFQELDWIAMKALAKERERRYESASGLAADIGRYLLDEPVLAGPPSTRYRLRKFVKRNRGRVIAAAAVLVALVAGVVGTSLGLVEAMRSADAERVAKGKAVAARDKALAALDATTTAITGESLATQKAITPEQKAFLAEVIGVYRLLAEEKGDDESTRRQIAAAAFRVGTIEYRLGRGPESAAAFRTAIVEYERLAADFPTPEHRRYFAGAHNELGLVLGWMGQRDDAEQHYRIALEMRQRLSTESDSVLLRRDLAGSHSNLGFVFSERRKWPEAEAEFRQSLAIHTRLTAERTDVPDHLSDLAVNRNNLAFVLTGQRKWADAEREYRAALADGEKLTKGSRVAEYQFDLALSHNGLGRVLAVGKRWVDAERQYRRAVEVTAKLTDAFPSVPEYVAAVSRYRYDLGMFLTDRGATGAEVLYRQAVAATEPLTKEFQLVPQYRLNLSRQRNNLGLSLAERSDPAAEKEYLAAIALAEKLVANDGGNVGYRIHLGGCYCNLGSWVRDAGKPADSLPWFDKAIERLNTAKKEDPNDSDAGEFLRNSHASRAEALGLLDRHAEAVAEWDRAVELSPAEERAGVRTWRARALVRTEKVAEAVAEVNDLTTKYPLLPADAWYAFADVYAVASAKAEGDTREAYAKRAVELLRRATQAGFSDVARLSADPVFKPLHQRPEFKTIVRDLEAKARPK